MNSSLTIVIVTFNPNYEVLNNCLKSIDENYKIIIIDNSKNLNDKKIINFSKKKILIHKNNNLGNGHGINIGINLATSKYVLYLDVDTILDKNLIKNLVACANEIEDFAVIGPNLKNYSYKNTDFLKIEELEKKYCKMKFIEGAIMLFNKNIILENKISFDEKIFLYWEERDFFHQCLKKKQKIYLIKNLFAFHQGGSSIAKLDFPDIELNRNWHYMWSKFYFYKKNYSILSGYKNTLRQFFSSFFKLIFFTILNNNKKKIYYERFSGLINSYAGRKSWRRPIL